MKTIVNYNNSRQYIAVAGLLISIIIFFLFSAFLKKKRGDSNNYIYNNRFVNLLNTYRNEAFIIIVWIIGLLILLKFIIMLGNITSGSMEPTLMTGDICVYNRLAYTLQEPQRGDIINFVEKDSGELYSKRIIGLAGDTVEFYDGYVYLNGELLDESGYLDEDVDTKCLDTFTVPDDCVFVLGDNRENSKDSRYFSYHYVSVYDIRAKYLFTLPWF
ncbi:MAG: signal peptidase I [Pseudobutyrivibrio sp.]|nr:signal peptidase I [Pseudobutyrivibrio sp.]